MLRFPAHAFVSLIHMLAKSETFLQVNSQWIAQPDASPLPGSEGIRAELIRQGISEDQDALMGVLCKKWQLLRETLSPFLNEIEKACAALQLDSGLAKVARMRQEFKTDVVESDIFICLQGHFKDLRERIEDQLKNRFFVFFPPEKEKYFLLAKPFGDKVHDRFPNITADTVDAGRCFGCGRFPAAVYHLMRVMEFGVRRLAKRLKLPKHLEHKPWGKILEAARAAINDLPYGSTRERNRRDMYSEIVAHLSSVKDAWRNPTMHSKCRYTEEEAEAIYNNVKIFMNCLADKRL